MSRELTMIDERRWSEERRGVKRKRVERRGEERRGEERKGNQRRKVSSVLLKQFLARIIMK